MTTYIESGDFVIDPIDGELREVTNVYGNTVFLKGGGEMHISECNDILLPSEAEAYA